MVVIDAILTWVLGSGQVGWARDRGNEEGPGGDWVLLTGQDGLHSFLLAAQRGKPGLVYFPGGVKPKVPELETGCHQDRDLGLPESKDPIFLGSTWMVPGSPVTCWAPKHPESLSGVSLPGVIVYAKLISPNEDRQLIRSSVCQRSSGFHLRFSLETGAASAEGAQHSQPLRDLLWGPEWPPPPFFALGLVPVDTISSPGTPCLQAHSFQSLPPMGSSWGAGALGAERPRAFTGPTSHWYMKGGRKGKNEAETLTLYETQRVKWLIALSPWNVFCLKRGSLVCWKK